MFPITRSNVVTLDFETFYSAEYTLSKLSTSEYIRDERFHAHGVGVKIGEEPAAWYTGAQIPEVLAAIPWDQYALLCHNTAFDGLILTHYYGVKPAFYLDTLSMSRAIHGAHQRHDLGSLLELHQIGKKDRAALESTKDVLELTDELRANLGYYCLNDTDKTSELFWLLYEHLTDEELRLIDLTVRMFTEPKLLIDLPRAQEALEQEVGKKAAAILRAGARVEDLMSNPKFAGLLVQVGYKPPMKISPTTRQPTFAFARTDQGMRDLLDNTDSRVRALADARIKVKSTIGETRAARLLEAGKDGMCLPVLLNYCGAHTTRWSGGNKCNVQNLPRGGELRKSIIAPPGQVIVVADSSQIEARIVAWLAGQSDLVEAFERGEDVYMLMASRLYGKPVSEVTKDERNIGKVCVLALGFSLGAGKLQASLAQGMMGLAPIKKSYEECQEIVGIYRAMNPQIVGLWKDMQKVIEGMTADAPGQYGCLRYGHEFIQLPNGLFLHYPELRVEGIQHGDDYLTQEASYKTRAGRGKLYGGLMTENVVQALARCIIGKQMLEVDERYDVVSMSHDEIIALAPEDEGDEARAFMLGVMKTRPEWAPDLPLAAEGYWNTHYAKPEAK